MTGLFLRLEADHVGDDGDAFHDLFAFDFAAQADADGAGDSGSGWGEAVGGADHDAAVEALLLDFEGGERVRQRDP